MSTAHSDAGLLETLGRLYSDAQDDKDWVLLLVAVAMAVNRMTLISGVYERQGRHLSVEGRASLVLRMRETCVKVWPLQGFPRTIVALKAINGALEPEVAALLDTRPRRHLARTEDELREQHDRGLAFFTKTYGKVTDRVISSLSAASHDLAECAIHLIYGFVLDHDSILGPRETALVEFVSCLAQACPDQAKGHLIGSRNHGASYDQVLRATELTVEICATSPCPVDLASMPWLPGQPEERGR